MSIIPVISAAVMARTLLRAGFVVVRQTGSHLRLAHFAKRRAVTIPMHAGDLSRQLTSSILKQAGLTTKEFLKLLGK